MKPQRLKRHETSTAIRLPMKVNCVGCGKNFWPLNSHIKYCSNKCRRMRTKNRAYKYQIIELQRSAF